MEYDRLLGKAGEVTRPAARHHQAPVHDHFHTFTFLCQAPLVRERFEHLMRTLPPTVWRAKCFVRFTDSDEQWMFQSVAGYFAMVRSELLPVTPVHVVCIGKGFNRAGLRNASMDVAVFL